MSTPGSPHFWSRSRVAAFGSVRALQSRLLSLGRLSGFGGLEGQGHAHAGLDDPGAVGNGLRAVPSASPNALSPSRNATEGVPYRRTGRPSPQAAPVRYQPLSEEPSTAHKIETRNDQRSVKFSMTRTIILVPILYLATLGVATYPAFAHLRSALPAGLPDPLMHLWVMRWYKSCLVQGRLPWVCPELQYPIGAPLAHFSPMHLQGLLYIPLSSVCSNDTLCYNLLWIGGFLFTALGTFALAWYVLRDVVCAWFAGLLAMLAGPMMMHAQAHLEIIYAGGFPFFLVAWMRFVDAPSSGRLIAASATFLIMTMGAAYYMVLALPPAVCYVVWRSIADPAPWRRRVRGLLAFSAISALPLVLLFSSQFWALAHGLSMRRERSQFNYYAASLWSYVAPTTFHLLGGAFPFDIYAQAGQGGPKMGESASYLGVVTLILVQVAAIRRVKERRIGFLWFALGLLVLLSMGSSCRVGSIKIGLPGAWLWDYVPVFRLTRNPARFNLLAAPCAAVLAAAGLRSLIENRRVRSRVALAAALSIVAVFDLGVHSFTGSPIPAMPACYAELAKRKPHPSFLELPLTLSGAPWVLTSSCGYWQSIHGCPTSAGYSGHDNEAFDANLVSTSPFSFFAMHEAAYLASAERMNIDICRDVRFDDYVWLYLHTRPCDFIVLHQWPLSMVEIPVRLDLLKDRLRPALVWDDGRTAVYDPARLPAPSAVVSICGEGWLRRGPWRRRPTCPIGRQAGLVVFNPDPAQTLTLSIEAESFRAARTVKVLLGDDEVARWDVPSGRFESFESPPFRLPKGLSTLVFQCDGEARPRSNHEAIAEGEVRSYSLRVAGLKLAPAHAASTLQARNDVPRGPIR